MQRSGAAGASSSTIARWNVNGGIGRSIRGGAIRGHNFNFTPEGERELLGVRFSCRISAVDILGIRISVREFPELNGMMLCERGDAEDLMNLNLIVEKTGIGKRRCFLHLQYENQHSLFSSWLAFVSLSPV